MTELSLHTIWRTTRGCYAWWLGELFTLLPAGVRERLPESRQVPFVDLADLLDSGTSLPERVRLRLPADQVLHKALTLPLAAERDLRSSMALQLPQLTPYVPEQACFDTIVTSRDASSGQLSVLLVVAPLPTVVSALETAHDRGVEIEHISAIDDAIDLTPQQGSGRIKARLFNLTSVLVGLALVATAFIVPLRQQQDAGSALRQELDAVKTQAEEGLTIQDELDAILADTAFLINHKTTTPAASAVLAEVTNLLPNTAWLSEFHQTGTSIRLVGFAPEATALLTIFETSPHFVEARFNSPVTLSADQTHERFDITFVYDRETGS